MVQMLDGVSFAHLAEMAKDRFDYLVNNAGISHRKAIEATTEEEFDRLYNVHLKGVLFLTQKLLPLLRAGGRIVNVSTGLTVEVTRYLAKELGPRGASP